MAYTEFYVNPTATGNSNLNAGSTDGPPVFTSTNGNFVSTGTFTITDGASTSGLAAGMWASIYVNNPPPTNTTVVARITSVTATTIVISTTVRLGAALTTVAGNGNVNIIVGGAWSGPSGTSTFPFAYTGTTVFANGVARNVAGDLPRYNFKNSTYNITTGITWTPVGTAPALIEGYTNTPGDGGRAIISGSGVTGSSIVLFTMGSSSGCYIKNFVFNNNGDTGTSDGVVIGGAFAMLERVGIYNIRGRGLHFTATNITAIECEAYNCNISNTANYSGIYAAGTATSASYIRCLSWNNAGSNSCGFISTGMTPAFINCIAYNNGASGFKLSITTNGSCARLSNCVSDKNTNDGIEQTCTSTNGVANYIENCILTRNGRYGINNSAAIVFRYAGFYNCMFGTNTSGNIGGFQSYTESGSINLALNESPFVNADAGDFDLNTSVTAGTSALNAGRGTFLQAASGGFSGTNSYVDVGASQALITSGGSSEKSFLFC